MGLRRALRLVETAPPVDSAVRLGLESPWVDNTHLERITWEHLYGAELPVVTRAEAMSVPAIARARHLCVSTIARLPLIAYRAGTPLDPQPLWTTRADATESPLQRMARTVDDLIFEGESLWTLERDREGNVVRASHIPYSWWETDPDGVLLVNGAPRPASTLCHIPGLHEGLLTFGADIIRGARGTLDAAVDTARRPFRVELHDTGDYPMSRDEARTLVADTRQALTDNAGVLYTTPGVEAKVHPVDAGALLVDGRESFAVDAARAVGLPAPLLDAYANGATLTYQNTRDVLDIFLNLGLTLYMAPITARLSLDDVTPRGQEVRFAVDEVLGVQALTEARDPGTPTAPTTGDITPGDVAPAPPETP